MAKGFFNQEAQVEAQVEGRSLVTQTERSWQTNRKSIKPKRQE